MNLGSNFGSGHLPSRFINSSIRNFDRDTNASMSSKMHGIRNVWTPRNGRQGPPPNESILAALKSQTYLDQNMILE